MGLQPLQSLERLMVIFTTLVEHRSTEQVLTVTGYTSSLDLGPIYTRRKVVRLYLLLAITMFLFCSAYERKIK